MLGEKGRKIVDDVAGDFVLGLPFVVRLPVGGDDADLVLVRLETGAGIAQGVEDYEVQIFLLQFLTGVGLLIICFKCEASE